MAKIRNHQAEYQRRIANAESRGHSRSQARGHAKAGEPAIKSQAKLGNQKFEDALKLYRRTGNQAAAAKSEGIAPERFRRFLRENVEITGRGKSLKIIDDRPRVLGVYTAGEFLKLTLPFDQSSLAGRHLNAVKAYVSSNDTDLLRPFEGRSVIDVDGVTHPLETTPNTLHRIAASGEPAFAEIYHIVQ